MVARLIWTVPFGLGTVHDCFASRPAGRRQRRFDSEAFRRCLLPDRLVKRRSTLPASAGPDILITRRSFASGFAPAELARWCGDFALRAHLDVFRSPPSLLGGSNDWSLARESDRIMRSTEQARRGRRFSDFLNLVQNRRPTEQARRRRCASPKVRVGGSILRCSPKDMRAGLVCSVCHDRS